MKQQYLMLQPLGWEAIILSDEQNSNLILFKRVEDEDWYQGMYRYDKQKFIADTIEYKQILENNRYTILSVLFAMIQEENVCKQIILSQTDDENGFVQKNIPKEKIYQYPIRYANIYDSYSQNQNPSKKEI